MKESWILHFACSFLVPIGVSLDLGHHTSGFAWCCRVDSAPLVSRAKSVVDIQRPNARLTCSPVAQAFRRWRRVFNTVVFADMLHVWTNQQVVWRSSTDQLPSRFCASGCSHGLGQVSMFRCSTICIRRRDGVCRLPASRQHFGACGPRQQRPALRTSPLFERAHGRWLKARWPLRGCHWICKRAICVTSQQSTQRSWIRPVWMFEEMIIAEGKVQRRIHVPQDWKGRRDHRIGHVEDQNLQPRRSHG